VADCNRRRVLGLLLPLLAVGCGDTSAAAKRPMGTLKGKLTINGAPAPAKTGLVFQHAETGSLYLAVTEPDGAFKVEKPQIDMPAGRYDVSVSPNTNRDESGQEAAEEALGDRPNPSKTGPNVEIPKKYLNSHESGLGFELQAGPNDRNIELKK
jgi:hypothetical protein